MAKRDVAVAVIPGKFWITYDSTGSKTGTMRVSEDDPGWLIQYLSDGSKIAHDNTSGDIEKIFEFRDREVDPEQVDETRQVFSYPVKESEVFKTQERDNLPCYTKTQSSKVFYAAGYYGILFSNGEWLDSFCPKLSTLKKNRFIGPFKTASDMNIAIQRKKRSQ